MDILVKNVILEHQQVDIAIDNGEITGISEKILGEAETVINAQGGIGFPGFTNCHAHIDKCNLYEYGHYVDGTGPEKGALTRKAKELFTYEDIFNRAETFIKESIQMGTLHLRTNVDVDPIVGLKGIEALLSLREKYADAIHIQIAAFAQEGFQKYPETRELLEEALRMGADLIGGHTIVDGPASKKHIDIIFSIAQKFSKEIDFHLDESGNREHYLLPYVVKKIFETGYYGKVNGIHCCTLSALTEQELELAISEMVKAEMKVTIAPTAISTRQLAPVKKLIAAGIPIGIGTDNMGDYFNPLGSPNVQQMGLLLAYVHRFYTNEDVSTIWKSCTSGGSEILKLEYDRIDVGSSANITIVNADSPKTSLARQADVLAVIRNGKIVK